MLREATVADAPEIAALAADRRQEYAAAQPRFWRQAEGALERHRAWLAATISEPDHVSLVAYSETLTGYLLASVVEAPPVYDPGGLTGMVDDFAVARPELWRTVGRHLLEEASTRLNARGAVQIVVVCGHHDQPKRSALRDVGLTIASEWWVGSLPSAHRAR